MLFSSSRIRERNAPCRRPPRLGSARRDRSASGPVQNALVHACAVDRTLISAAVVRITAGVAAFGTWSCADGRRAAQPRWEEAPQAGCASCLSRLPLLISDWQG